MTPAEPLDLDAIQARADAATQAPWFTEETGDVWMLFGDDGSVQIAKTPKRDTPYAEYWPDPADATFITHAREDVPALIAEVRRLLEALDHAGRRESELLDMLETMGKKGPAA